MNKFDGIVGMLGATVGLIGVGYALAMHSKMAKMAKISENLDHSIDELANHIPVDIPDAMVERALEKAVAVRVKDTVAKATDEVVAGIKRDIHKQVSDVIESEYSNIKDTVLEEIVTEAAKIDVKRVRADVEKAAKDHAIEKFDDNLDNILENFSDQLKNTSRIYTSIADTMAGYKTSGRETVLRIGSN